MYLNIVLTHAQGVTVPHIDVHCGLTCSKVGTKMLAIGPQQALAEQTHTSYCCASLSKH